jgi:hypothetical protein
MSSQQQNNITPTKHRGETVVHFMAYRQAKLVTIIPEIKISIF